MKNITKIMLSGLFLFSSFQLIGQPLGQPYDGSFNPDFQNRPGVRVIQWLNRFENAVATSKETHKPILILFTGTDWCRACMNLEREVLNHPQFAADIADKFIFLKAEFPEGTAAAIANSPFKSLFDRYAVRTFPTIVVVDPEGERLFVVNYQQGGPRAYAQELLGKLQQFGGRLNPAALDQARDRFNQARDQFSQNRDQFNQARDQFSQNRDQFNQARDQFRDKANQRLNQNPTQSLSSDGKRDEKMDNEGYYIP